MPLSNFLFTININLLCSCTPCYIQRSNERFCSVVDFLYTCRNIDNLHPIFSDFLFIPGPCCILIRVWSHIKYQKDWYDRWCAFVWTQTVSNTFFSKTWRSHFSLLSCWRAWKINLLQKLQVDFTVDACCILSYFDCKRHCFSHCIDMNVTKEGSILKNREK